MSRERREELTLYNGVVVVAPYTNVRVGKNVLSRGAAVRVRKNGIIIIIIIELLIFRVKITDDVCPGLGEFFMRSVFFYACGNVYARGEPPKP